MSSGWHGMLLVDKPAGPTSHDLVARVRKATGERRIGHAGTLDPPATGLLVLLLGTATRLAGYLPASPKVYRGAFRLGVTTLTDDLAGALLTRHVGPLPVDESVRDAAARLLGVTQQIPPAISAKHVAGERLYRAARRGSPIAAPPATIEVGRFDVTPSDEAGTWTFEASVSSGTYIRGLVRDLGAALGCGAAVVSLRRTTVGPLDVSAAAGAWTAEALAQALVGLDAIPLAIPSVALSGHIELDRFLHGREIEGRPVADPRGLVAVRDWENRLLGIGRIESGVLAPRTVLPWPRVWESLAVGPDPVITSRRF